MDGRAGLPTSTRRLPLWRQPVVGFGLALIAVTWLGAAALIFQEKRAIETERADDAENLALILEQNVRETVRALDQTLEFVRAMEAHDDFKPDWPKILAEETVVEGDAVQVGVIDENGMLVSSNLDPRPSKPLDLSDRAHFRAQAEAQADNLYIAPIVVGRVSGKPTVQLSRKRLSRDGRFAGVVVASLSADFFQRDFAKLDLGDGGLALVGDDGWVRAGNGGFRGQVGKRLVADAGEGFVSVKPVAGYPLRVVARLPGIESDPEWRKQRDMFLGAASLLSLVSLAVTLLVALRRARYEANILYMSRHDALTDLPNRASLMERLEAHYVSRGVETEFALHMIDLDRFKIVNDTYGHATGDELLRAVAARLRGEVGPRDMVARLGGDEFAVVQRLGDLGDSPATLAKHLCRVLARQFPVTRANLSVGATIGFALARHDGLRSSELLKAADIALYAAKARERGTFLRYHRSMTEKVDARLRMESGLREALGRDEFVVVYQPIKSLENESTLGFEALLRWRRDGKDVAPPSEFIPVAEDLGLIGDIGAWVLHRACADISARPGRHTISVNSSALQFDGLDYSGVVEDVLARTGLSPERLQIEITESVLVKDRPAALEQLRQLRALGVRVAIDDFGTGYSCLAYLEIYPIDTLKIDRQFVDKLGRRKDAGATIRAIIDLAASYGIDTIAEGIETREQLRALSELGCLKGQGYLLGRPGPMDACVETVLPRPALSGAA